MFNIFRRKNSNQKDKADYLADKLEIAKQQLIADLGKGDMQYLVTKMGNNEEYSELILERRKIDLSYSSEDSVSWYAYKQSDKLHSDEDKKELLELLKNEKFYNYKKYVYCCLANICSNTNDKVLFNFLIDKIQREDDESTRISILSRLQDIKKDLGYNITPIKILVKEGTQGETRAAIRALSNTIDPEVEDIFLNEFKISDSHMKGTICGPLSTVGTVKSIPILKEVHKKTRDRGLRALIENTINKIEDRAKSCHQHAVCCQAGSMLLQ